MTTKAIIRNQMKQRRARVGVAEHDAWSEAIYRAIIAEPLFESAKTIGIFWPIRQEVDVLRLFAQKNKQLVFPRVRDQVMDFASLDHSYDVGSFGQHEPTRDQVAVVPDLLIVPLLAFDEHCNRLGYGGGYYDRYLAENLIATIGVAFECQKVAALVVEKYDQILDIIVTEKHTYRK